MDIEKLNELVAKARYRQDSLLEKKGSDYTRHDPDRLANFKRLAKDLDLPPIKIWAVYAGKHWDALMAFIKTGKAESEAIEGRFDDLHNYLYLLEGLLEDEKQEKPLDCRPGEIIHPSSKTAKVATLYSVWSSDECPSIPGVIIPFNARCKNCRRPRSEHFGNRCP